MAAARSRPGTPGLRWYRHPERRGATDGNHLMTKRKASSTPKTHAQNRQDTKAAPQRAFHTPDALPGIAGKLGRVAGAVSTERGATIEELISTTGWQPHTIRAALTRLRRRGVDARLTVNGDRKAYRATAAGART